MKDFVIAMDIPSAKSCVLCFREIINEEERYLVQGRGKFDVFQELKSLSFDVKSTSRFMCKECLNKCKKRRNLITQLADVVSFLEKAHTGYRADPDLK